MAKKLNPALLQEELKKFKLLTEYTFYTEKDDSQNGNDLILGSGLDEEDENPEGGENGPVDPSAAQNTAAPEAGAAPEGEDDNLFDTNDTPEAGAIPDDVQPADQELPAEPPVEPTPEANDDIEVDVTQLVHGSEEATKAATDASQKTSELMSKFEELEQRMSKMGSIAHKIESLEQEIIKRNPTPVEKLEMRSLDSYPFNIKLNDYWKDVDGYDANGKDEPEEFVLTKDDVDNGFTDLSIKKSLDSPEDYDEEDVY